MRAPTRPHSPADQFEVAGSPLEPAAAWLELAGDILILAAPSPNEGLAPQRAEAPEPVQSEDPWAELPLSAQLHLWRFQDRVRGSEDGD